MAPFVPLLALLTIAHPGHGEHLEECREIEGLSPLYVVTREGGEALGLARLLLSRGNAGEAARIVAVEALLSPEAGEILAEALDALGDPTGAENARQRAAAQKRGAAPPR